MEPLLPTILFDEARCSVLNTSVESQACSSELCFFVSQVGTCCFIQKFGQNCMFVLLASFRCYDCRCGPTFLVAKVQ